MSRFKIFFALMFIVLAVALSSCSDDGDKWLTDDSKPCKPMAVKPSDNAVLCPAGGTYCTNENDICKDGWFFNSYCITTYRANGTCQCFCQ